MSGMAFGGADEGESGGLIARASDIAQGLNYPKTAFFHIAFKTAAILIYMFGSWFSSNFVNIFVLCVLMLAFDFWTVKNVSGRLMVGLRWWSEVRDDGSTDWKYECRDGNLNATTMDVAIFWIGLLTPAFIWFIFGVGSVFRLSFDWLLLIAIALALSGANIVGYVRCKQEAGTRLMSGLQGVMGRTGMGSNVMGQALQSAAGKAFGL
ncbi:hypothetical protein EMIHUDRAFT_432859 [Emiliania huxleyi CCMP1516]|uniref:Golgi apparatus membrane protein TVP23 homolog n=2 Tax=Emiliania huxleyi TaxID=2903 RepID=A0A0D3IDW8_EMIH1|nr:hypothetical protein EMIHUDRAFT_432859 [Emiliania huxleyi CCMP1516]EOD09453.1 hypothetical protein EMIHUDRAFT_432859 [Emiliania huxleyi CCMP1516]|mmetsp:Transcript_10089/g.33334  ORF Transcript_10089/g.33334 Transcript_10089/m.33334 type:complete len:208 (+) Transcript_10089:1072-1695(+)|eukprot:XP_005761882.1 hypothetical protein EMIHUDRAFT_432859 [Emiliania huxleyi CCMP1516]